MPKKANNTPVTGSKSVNPVKRRGRPSKQAQKAVQVKPAATPKEVKPAPVTPKEVKKPRATKVKPLDPIPEESEFDIENVNGKVFTFEDTSAFDKKSVGKMVIDKDTYNVLEIDIHKRLKEALMFVYRYIEFMQDDDDSNDEDEPICN